MARSGDVGVAGAPERGYWIGPLCAVVGVLGFSFKAILIKLAYAWSPIDAVTLLALRMIYAAPMFAVMAMLAARRPDAKPISKRDWLALAWLGFIGYYLSSLLDFIGLQYITASLERLVLFLYPTIVVVLSALFLRRPITRKAVGALLLCYAGIGLVFWHDLKVTGDPASTALGGALVFASAVGYAIYLVGAGGVIARLGSLRFIALAMLISAGFVIGACGAVPCPNADARDGDLFHRPPDLADRGIDTPRRRERRIACRVSRSRIHHRTGGVDPRRTDSPRSTRRRRARADRRRAGVASLACREQF